jgi:hypothetical protein
MKQFIELLDAYIDEREEDSIGPRQFAARQALIAYVSDLRKTERERCTEVCVSVAFHGYDDGREALDEALRRIRELK